MIVELEPLVRGVAAAVAADLFVSVVVEWLKLDTPTRSQRIRLYVALLIVRLLMY